MSSPADPVRTGVEGEHGTYGDGYADGQKAAGLLNTLERERREAAEAEVARRMGPTASAVWIERCREAEAERDRLRAGIERSAVDHDRRADGSQWVPFIRTHRQAATELRSLLAGSGVKEEPNV